MELYVDDEDIQPNQNQTVQPPTQSSAQTFWSPGPPVQNAQDLQNPQQLAQSLQSMALREQPTQVSSSSSA